MLVRFAEPQLAANGRRLTAAAGLPEGLAMGRVLGAPRTAPSPAAAAAAAATDVYSLAGRVALLTITGNQTAAQVVRQLRGNPGAARVQALGAASRIQRMAGRRQAAPPLSQRLPPPLPPNLACCLPPSRLPAAFSAVEPDFIKTLHGWHAGSAGGAQPREAAGGRRRLRQAAVTPNDALYAQAWHQPQVQLPQAWATSTGSKQTKVCIIDSGTHMDHEDLAANLGGGWNR